MRFPALAVKSLPSGTVLEETVMERGRERLLQRDSEVDEDELACFYQSTHWLLGEDGSCGHHWQPLIGCDILIDEVQRGAEKEGYGMNENEREAGVTSSSYPQEPLYSNFPWFNCMARSDRKTMNGDLRPRVLANIKPKQ